MLSAQSKPTARPALGPIARRMAILAAAMALAAVTAPRAEAQTLRFSNHRELAIPPYATLRIGPFYSTAALTETFGYTYTRTTGSGTDYLFDNHRGGYIKDGGELPIVSTLDFRNYVLITRHTDLDVSVRVSYEYYPLGTREDDFFVDLAEEGVFGDVSMEIVLTPYVKTRLYDQFAYRTDYIDTRGIEDRYGGEEYEYIRNQIGADTDWLMSKNQNLGLSLSRTDIWPYTDAFMDQESTTYTESLDYQHILVAGIGLGARASFYQTDYADKARSDTARQDYILYATFDRSEKEGLRLRLTDVSMLTVGLGYSVGYDTSQQRQVSEGIAQTDATDEDSESFVGFARLTTQLRKDLSHELGYERGLRGGFRTSFERFTGYHYLLSWKGVVSAATFFSSWTEVEPSDEAYTKYTDWQNGFDFSYPLVPAVTLFTSGRYSVRYNEGEDPAAGLPDESTYDYTTWFLRLGTSFSLTKKLSFSLYAQRTERTSDSDNLSYSRDEFGALFTYRHQF